MPAIPGGKAKPEKIDSPQSAVLVRGGRIPMAEVYPPEMRAPRDLRRRRCPRMRKRAEVLAPIQNTNRQYNLPEIGKQVASKAKREGGAEPFPEPRVRKPIELDLPLIDHDEKLWGAGALSIPPTAKGHDGQTFSPLPSVPGSGKSLALVRLYELPDLARFPRGQDFVSYWRLVKGAKESAGKRLGTSGQKIANPPLKGACSEAAVLFWPQNHPGQEYFAQLERNHGQGKALTVLAHQRARAGYSRLLREQPCELQRFVTA